MLISSYLQIKAPIRTYNGEVTSIGVGYLTVFLALIFLPMSMIYVLAQPIGRLKDEEFEESWGNIYYGMKTRSKWQAAFYFLLIIRRILSVFIAFELFTLNTW